MPVIVTAFTKLPPITRALIWMVFGALTGGMMNVLIRAGQEELDPLQVVFFRNFFALLIMMPILGRHGLARLKTGKIGFYTLRAGVSFISMTTWFVGVAEVPLATATALNFTAPLFATALAAIILREKVRARRWSAVAVGLAGTVVVLRPFGPVEPAMLILLLSALTAAMSSITVKYLARSEDPGAIIAYMVIYLTPMSLVPALFVWTWPSAHALFLMVALGAFGVASHYGVVNALSLVDASATTPFEFLKLPYAAFLGYVIYGERPDIWSWVGAAIIIGSSLYVAHRESRLGRQSPERVSGGRAPPLPPG